MDYLLLNQYLPNMPDPRSGTQKFLSDFKCKQIMRNTKLKKEIHTGTLSTLV